MTSSSRRHDRIGVHSIGEFHMTVPSLEEATRFYAAFGLRIGREGVGLTLRAAGSEHVWGRLSEGPRKRFDRMTFHCFADEAEQMYRHILAQGVERIQTPLGADDTGLWMSTKNRALEPRHIRQDRLSHLSQTI